MIAEIQMQPREILQIAQRIHANDVKGEWERQAGVLGFSDFQKWFNRVWTEVESALEAVIKQGATVIDKWVRRVMNEIDEMRKTLGEAADEALSIVKAKLAELQHQVCQAAIDLLPVKLTVRGEEVQINEISVDYAIQIQVGVEASLTWALKMAAAGTLTVSASYATQT